MNKRDWTMVTKQMPEQKDIEQIEIKLQQLLKPSRYQHSLSTAKTARDLAEHWQQDTTKAYLAGLLHDHARRFSDEELLAMAEEHSLKIDLWTREHAGMLHGPVAAALLDSEWGIADEQIYEAIYYHTVPAADMGAIAKIVYLADKIEPTREAWPGQQRVCLLAKQNMDEAIVASLQDNMLYLATKGESAAPNTQEIIEKYRNKIVSNKQ